MEVKLTKPWRYWQNGCKPIDFKAGLVTMTEDALKVAMQCGVVEKKVEKKTEKKVVS